MHGRTRFQTLICGMYSRHPLPERAALGQGIWLYIPQMRVGTYTCPHMHAQWWSPWRRKNVENRAPHSAEFNFFINCDRQKQFSQNERRRADLQKVASEFLSFAWGLSHDLSKFSDDDFPPFFRLWKTITKSLGKNSQIWGNLFLAMNMMNKRAKFHKDSLNAKKVARIPKDCASQNNGERSFRRSPLVQLRAAAAR